MFTIKKNLLVTTPFNFMKYHIPQWQCVSQQQPRSLPCLELLDFLPFPQKHPAPIIALHLKKKSCSAGSTSLKAAFTAVLRIRLSDGGLEFMLQNFTIRLRPQTVTKTDFSTSISTNQRQKLRRINRRLGRCIRRFKNNLCVLVPLVSCPAGKNRRKNPSGNIVHYSWYCTYFRGM